MEMERVGKRLVFGGMKWLICMHEVARSSQEGAVVGAVEGLLAKMEMPLVTDRF
jgi:hypothetical protein